MIPITQAMISAGPGAVRVAPGNDYVVTEDLVYPFDFGNAIQNDYVGGTIRIFGNGHKLTNLPGGGPYSGTLARGVVILATQVEIEDFTIGEGLGKFYVSLDLPTYDGANGKPDYSRTPGRHLLRNVEVSGWLWGGETMGDDCVFDRYRAVNCGGGGSGQLQRPIGIRHMGRRPTFVDPSVTNMVKGAYDTETMFYHLMDADNGVAIRPKGASPAPLPGSFGVWFNSTSRFDMIDADLDYAETVYAADLASGRIQGKLPTHCTTVASLPPAVDLVLS